MSSRFPRPIRVVLPLLAVALVPASLPAQADAPASDQELMDRASIAFGTQIARDLKEDGIRLNLEKVTAAMAAVLEGKEPLASEEDIRKTFTELGDHLREAGKRKNAEFLEANKKKEGVKVTASGLQYEVLQAAPGGAKPKATDQVKVHYTGKLINGTVFDSSVERGEPITFGLGQVIPGWTEGLQLMGVGEKFRLTIPYNLAYGEQGSPPTIPGFSTLVFDVELLGINPAP
jgi:FKBP-type peptidyl-prolyl cis-trans isomerase FklB